MAKTPAERTREFRERQRAAERAARLTPPSGANYSKRSFAEFLGDRPLLLDENLDAFGVQIFGSLGDEVQVFPSEYIREEPLTSLERAIGLVGVFLDAAKELAHLINVYKLEEVENAINAAVERSANLPRGDVEALKASFAEIDRLKAIRTELRKPTRHTVLGTAANAE